MMGEHLDPYRHLDLLIQASKEERERRYSNLFIGQTRRVKPLPPPLIDIKEGEE